MLRAKLERTATHLKRYFTRTEYSDFYQKYIGNSKDKHQQNRKRYNYKDQERLQEAFQSVLRISPLFPMNPKYRKLCHQFKLYSRKDPFRVPLPYNRHIFDEIQVWGGWKTDHRTVIDRWCR